MTERKPRRRRTAQTLHSFPVTMAKGIHLFPYRTQKLSLSAPMVLGWRRPGRVGRCRIPQRKSLRRCLGLFLCASRQVLLPGRFQANVQHCTWESRTLPDSMKKGLTPYGVGSFFIPSATFLFSGRLQSMCDIVLGYDFFLPPAVRDSGRKNHLGE